MEIKVGKKNVVDHHRSSITAMFVVVSYMRYREVHKNRNPSAILRPQGWNTSNPLVTRNSGNTVSMEKLRQSSSTTRYSRNKISIWQDSVDLDNPRIEQVSLNTISIQHGTN